MGFQWNGAFVSVYMCVAFFFSYMCLPLTHQTFDSLFGGICVLLLASLVQLFFPFSEGFQLALAIGGVIIFSGYIIFDTYLIFNRYSPEDYIMASASLYMDIINLFIRILQILNATQRD